MFDVAAMSSATCPSRVRNYPPSGCGRVIPHCHMGLRHCETLSHMTETDFNETMRAGRLGVSHGQGLLRQHNLEVENPGANTSYTGGGGSDSDLRGVDRAKSGRSSHGVRFVAWHAAVKGLAVVKELSGC
jgi:hypothetical protein